MAPMRALLPVLTSVLLLLAGCTTPPDPRPARAPGHSDEVVRLQIFLDEAGFGPGVIDGRMGEFTVKAAALWAAARGLPAGTDLAGLPEVRAVEPYTIYTVTSSDVARVGPVPVAVEEQAKLKGLPYRSLGELVAERYHTTRRFLATLNPGVNLVGLQAGSTLRVPNVRPFRIEAVPASGNVPRRAALAGRTVEIDTVERMLEVREDGRVIAAFPITPGSGEHPAPAGTWRIVGISSLPWFRWDEGVLKRGERTEDFHLLPPGPNSPVGILWMGLSKPGIGIHGTNFPDSIGRAASHGCIRLSNWDADRMRGLVTTGARVVIR